MSSDTLIRLRGVGKSYPKFGKPYQRLVHMFVPGLFVREQFEALRGIDLDVVRGEAIAIIGRNGSGKSTLLQVIAGILQPSSGTLQVNARIAALLELGAGFNLEFTGRDNIHLNAGLLGLTTAEIDARMGDIIAFAEIGEHLEQPVKTYSSGMFMRLAFAIAVHADPDVLIVDEALSVGDVYFQRKCNKRIEELRQSGCTLLFVTHSIDTVLQLCDRGVVLERGALVFDGDASSAVKEYLKRVFGEHSVDVPTEDDAERQEAPAAQERSEFEAFLHGGGADQFATRPGFNRDETRLGLGGATTCDYLVAGSHGYGPLVSAHEPFHVHVRYHFPEAMDRLIFGIRVNTVTGVVVYATNTYKLDGHLHAASAGSVALVDFRLQCTLIPGQYFVTVGVSRYDDAGLELHAIDRRTNAIMLGVTGVPRRAEGTADLDAAIVVAMDGH